MNVDRALAGFDAQAFTDRHGGLKESRAERSHEYLLHCPHCGSERLRWHHSPDKQAWICWGCRASGDTVSLVQLLDGHPTRAAALNAIVDGYVGGDAKAAPTSNLRAPRRARTSPVRMLPRIDYPYGYEPISPHRPPHAPAIEYITRRGLSLVEAQRRGVGYSRVGRLARYVIFPCFMDHGLVYYQARATWDPPDLPKEQRKAWIKTTKYRKTLNPYGDEHEVAAASEVLYGYDTAAAYGHVVITEGPFDASKVGPHAVALLGKKASAVHIERLLRMGASRFTVYLDRGPEEQASARSLAERLVDMAPVFLAVPPEGHDPGSLSPQQNAAVIQMATPFRPARRLSSNLRIR
jgi:DNA primase